MSQVFQHNSGLDWALVLYRPTDCGTVKPILMEIRQPIVLSSSIYILLNTYKLNELHVITLTPLLPVTNVNIILYGKRNLNLISNMIFFFLIKLQITSLKFGRDWILHFEILEFGFYPPEVWWCLNFTPWRFKF